MRYENELIGLANEAWVARCLHAAANLGLSEHIGEGELTFQELAERCSADAATVEAILRILARRGIFAINGDAVSQSPKSRLLRIDHPSGIADIVGWIGSNESWNAFGHLTEASPDRSGFELAFGEPMFRYLARNPARFRAFSRSMAAFTKAQVADVVNSIDFTGFSTILDLGGGTGTLANAIAQRYPAAQTSIFDLPGVTDAGALKSSISVIEGDFFSDPIPRADLTILMNVLHDWSDSQATEILTAVRSANGPAGSICVIEGLTSSRSNMIEMIHLGMIAMAGGRQRSRNEFQELLRRSGYEISGETTCGNHLSALMARPNNG